MFAGSVMLGDLDDFISPSQACINPLFTDTKTNSKKSKNNVGSNSNDSNTTVDDIEKGVAKINLLSDLGSSLIYDTAIKPNLIKSVPVMSSSLSSMDAASSSPSSATATGTARVTLNDCLACSGCVTSAETVLIQQQSMEEVFKAINNPYYELIIVSISPQALASISAHSNLTSMVETFERLSTYLYSIGVHAVLDTQVALDCVLVEEIHQFIRKLQSYYQINNNADGSTQQNPGSNQDSSPSTSTGIDSTTKGKTLQWEIPSYSVGVSATRIRPFQDNRGNNATVSVSSSSSSSYVAPLFAASSTPQPLDIIQASIPGTDHNYSSSSASSSSLSSQNILPQLTSSCPGWVCYAEKTVPEILPYISTLKSPQQILGTFIKLLCSQGSVTLPRYRNSTTDTATSIDPSRIFHITIMPCYDKKLEASRRDFYWENDTLVTTLVPFIDHHPRTQLWEDTMKEMNNPSAEGVKEVDCVVTALEMVELLTNGSGSTTYQGINTLTNQTVPIPSNVKLTDIPRTPRRGYLYTNDLSSSSSLLPNVEELFCSIDPSTQSFAGGIASHSESDGYVSYLIRYLGLRLQGTLQRTGTSSSSRTTVLGNNPSSSSSPSTLSKEDMLHLYTNFSLPLPFTPSRTNNDLKEIILNIPYQNLQAYRFDGSSLSSSVSASSEDMGITDNNAKNDIQIPLVFATAYGFRNIQAIINKLKRTRNNQNLLPSSSSSSSSLSLPAPPAYAYVEIMACPQGCINGGGLVKVDIESSRIEKDNDRNMMVSTTTTSSSLKALADAQKQRIQEVNALVHTSERTKSNRTPFDTFDRLVRSVPLLQQIYDYRESNRRNTNYSVPWQYIFHTRYHAIPPLETNVVKW